jgi:hypothetical protein
MPKIGEGLGRKKNMTIAENSLYETFAYSTATCETSTTTACVVLLGAAQEVSAQPWHK